MTAARIQLDRAPIFGADRVYAGTRWALLLIVLALSTSVQESGAPAWAFPPQQSFGWAFWMYVTFACFATMAVMVRRWGSAVPWLYVGDVLGIAALAWSSTLAIGVFESLFFLPLVAIALRFPRPMIILWSLLTAGLQWALLARYGEPDLIGLASRTILIVALPMLVSILAEQWSADNRLSVQRAEQRTALALQQAEQYRDRMRALYEVAYTLSTTGSASHVLHTTLLEMARLLPHRCSAILLPATERNEVGVAASRHLTIGEQQIRFTVGQGSLGMVLRGAEGGMLPAKAHQEELSALPTLAACSAVLVVPMRAGIHTYGVAAFGLEEAPTTEQLEMASALVSYSLVALQNAQLIAELREERQRLLVHEEETRHQLNRDLHDGPAQALAAISMKLEFIKRLRTHEPARVEEEIDKLATLAKQANHDVRTLLFTLRPLVLETQGLLGSIRQFVERFAKEPTRIIVEGDEGPLNVSKQVEGMLFNMVQEAVGNALKHAEAQNLWIRLQSAPNVVTLTIQDDGRGFDVEAVRKNYDQRGSFGLLSIEERARLVSGAAHIVSVPGGGTTVKVQAPCEVE